MVTPNNGQLLIFPGEKDPAGDISYRQAVGSLMYLLVGTLLKLGFVGGKLYLN